MYSFLDIFTIVFLSQCLMRYLMIEQGVYHTLNCASSFAPPPPPLPSNTLGAFMLFI